MPGLLESVAEHNLGRGKPPLDWQIIMSVAKNMTHKAPQTEAKVRGVQADGQELRGSQKSRIKQKLRKVKDSVKPSDFSCYNQTEPEYFEIFTLLSLPQLHYFIPAMVCYK